MRAVHAANALSLALLVAACQSSARVEPSSEAPLVMQPAPSIHAPTQIFVHAIEVRLEGAPGLDIRFTVDGSDPRPESALYAGPMALASSTLLRACSFQGRRPASAVAERSFTRVEPLPAGAAGALEPGLRLTTYVGRWERLPDFGALAPVETLIVSDVSLGPRAELERVGHVYAGELIVPRTDVYLFRLRSDDGGRLWIDGERVVEVDGLHAPIEREGLLPLAAGPHALRVEHFNGGLGADLALSWSTGHADFVPLPPDALRHRP